MYEVLNDNREVIFSTENEWAAIWEMYHQKAYCVRDGETKNILWTNHTK